MKWERISESRLFDELAEANGDFHLLRSFLSLLPVAATVKDRLGRVLYANQAAARMYGRTAPTLVGREIERIISGIDQRTAAEIRRVERKVIEGKPAIMFQQLREAPHPIRHSVLKFAFFDSDGDPLLVSLIYPTQL